LLESFPIRDSIPAFAGEAILRIAALIGSMIVALLLGGMPASAGTRVALVIGNSAYQNVPFLPSPVNDAADLSASLRRLGFDVKTMSNARYDDMRQALVDFDQQARGAEFAVIFFAGHGFQIGGENWLIPVDAQLAIDLDVVNETIGLNSLTRAVSNATKLGLVILDASRDDPFRTKMQSTNLPRAVERGLSRVESSDNVLVVYAARDGTTAADASGPGRYSPYTSSLLKMIETPGLDIRALFARVRDDVMTATNQEQQPLLYGSFSCDELAVTKCGWAGLSLLRVSEDVANALKISPARGALIADVDQKGPAKAAGIQAGDVVVRFDGKDIKDSQDLFPAIKETQVGKEVDVVILRDTKQQSQKMIVGRRIDRVFLANAPRPGTVGPGAQTGSSKDQTAMIAPQTNVSSLLDRERVTEIKMTSRSPLQGALISNLSPALVRELRLGTEELVVVAQVPEGTTAAATGFRKGDIILKVNDGQIRKTDDLERVTRELSRLWRMEILRDGQKIVVTLGG
jgi:membrane-associated protease RseP (regulator of RpoE activity)